MNAHENVPVTDLHLIDQTRSQESTYENIIINQIVVRIQSYYLIEYKYFIIIKGFMFFSLRMHLIRYVFIEKNKTLQSIFFCVIPKNNKSNRQKSVNIQQGNRLFSLHIPLSQIDKQHCYQMLSEGLIAYNQNISIVQDYDHQQQ